MEAVALLRADLLAGRTIALGGGDALAPTLAALGAQTVAPPAADGEHVTVDALLHDLRPEFGGGGPERLRAGLDEAWVTIRAVAKAALIPRERGKIVLVAPPPDAGDPACDALRAATENLARTLSIEWSRYGITTVAITPGTHTTDDELAGLAAYLVSPAGDYFSGCRLALGEAVPA